MKRAERDSDYRRGPVIRICDKLEKRPEPAPLSEAECSLFDGDVKGGSVIQLYHPSDGKIVLDEAFVLSYLEVEVL